MAEPFLGQITMFAGTFNPRGWAYCAGQLLPISQNEALFSLLGTTYGGDGRTTFALPDLRGRSPRGSEGNSAGPGLNAVRDGETGGGVQHTLVAGNLPPHQHGLNNNVVEGPANQTDPAGHSPAETAANAYSDAAPGAVGGPAMTKNDGGSSQPFNILNPYLGINYIIATQGFFPSRN